METDSKVVAQEEQPVEQGNVQESTDSSADVGQLIADAKKYRHQRQEAEAKGQPS